MRIKLQACHVPMGTAVTGRSILDTVGSVFQTLGIPWDSILVGSNFRILPKSRKLDTKSHWSSNRPRFSQPLDPNPRRFSHGTKPEQWPISTQSKSLADPSRDQTAQQSVSSSGTSNQHVIRLDEKSNRSSYPDRATASNEQDSQLSDSTYARAKLGNPSSSPSAPTYKQVAAAQSKPITDSVNAGSALALQDNDLLMDIGSSDALLVKTKKRTRGSKPAVTPTATSPPSQIVKPWCSRNMLEGPSEPIHIRQGS